MCLLGKIVNDEMILSAMGEIVRNEWLKTTKLRPNVQLHEFIVMPNHFHTIFEITHKINLEQCENDDVTDCRGVLHTPSKKINITNYDVCEKGVCNTPLRSPSQTVGAIIRGFKSAISRQLGFSLWQRDMWEHIIRDFNDYQRIYEYIVNNPVNWKNDRFYTE
jgi:REP element-mobilizing transposase RayT